MTAQGHAAGKWALLSSPFWLIPKSTLLIAVYLACWAAPRGVDLTLTDPGSLMETDPRN